MKPRVHMETSYIEPWDDKHQAHRRTLRVEQVSEAPRPGLNLTVDVEVVIRLSNSEVLGSLGSADGFTAGMTLDAEQARELHTTLGIWLERSDSHRTAPVEPGVATVTDLSNKRGRKDSPR